MAGVSYNKILKAKGEERNKLLDDLTGVDTESSLGGFFNTFFMRLHNKIFEIYEYERRIFLNRAELINFVTALLGLKTIVAPYLKKNKQIIEKNLTDLSKEILNFNFINNLVLDLKQMSQKGMDFKPYDGNYYNLCFKAITTFELMIQDISKAELIPKIQEAKINEDLLTELELEVEIKNKSAKKFKETIINLIKNEVSKGGELFNMR